MPYLICDKCDIYYEIEADFDLSELEECEKCCEKLKYFETMEEYYKKIDNTPLRKKKVPKKITFQPVKKNPITT